MAVLGWVHGGALVALFLRAGLSKLVTTRSKLLENPKMAWAQDFTQRQIYAISVLEVLRGLGVVLPLLLNVAPVLTPVAAVGCGLIMVGALAVHLRRHEQKSLPPVVAVIRFSQL